MGTVCEYRDVITSDHPPSGSIPIELVMYAKGPEAKLDTSLVPLAVHMIMCIHGTHLNWVSG